MPDYSSAFGGAALCLLSAGLAEAQSNGPAQVNSPYLGQGLSSSTSDNSNATITLPGAVAPITQAQAAIDGNGLNLRTFHYASDGSDYAPALSRAYQLMNTNYLVGGLYTPVYVPGGSFALNTTLTTLPAPSVPAGLIGNGVRTSWLVPGAAFTGNVYQCSQTPIVFTTPTILPTAVTAGCRVQDITFSGNTTSSGQSAMKFYDSVDGVLVQNVAVYDMPGYCLSAGTTLNKTNAFFRESAINNLVCYNDGIAGQSSLYFSSTGTFDASNVIGLHGVRVLSSAGDGLVIENANLTSPVRQIKGEDVTVENSAGNNYRIGSGTLTGLVQTVDFIASGGISPSTGNSNLLITAAAAASAPSNLSFTDFQSLPGSGAGGGVNVQYGKNITVSAAVNTTAGAQLTLGCGISGPINVSGQGDESTWSTMSCGTFTAAQYGYINFGTLATVGPRASNAASAAFAVPGTSVVTDTGTISSRTITGGVELVTETNSITITSIGTASGSLLLALPPGTPNPAVIDDCTVGQAVSSVGTFPASGTTIEAQINPGTGGITPVSFKLTGISTWTAANTAVGTYTLNVSCLVF